MGSGAKGWQQQWLLSAIWVDAGTTLPLDLGTQGQLEKGPRPDAFEQPMTEDPDLSCESVPEQDIAEDSHSTVKRAVGKEGEGRRW